MEPLSASGDIDESVFSTDNVYQAFNAAGIELVDGLDTTTITEGYHCGVQAKCQGFS
jgi:hypothetical protein